MRARGKSRVSQVLSICRCREESFMSGERQVQVLYDERTIAERTEAFLEISLPSSRRTYWSSQSSRAPSCSRPSSAGVASRRVRSACRVLPSVELFGRHCVERHGQDFFETSSLPSATAMSYWSTISLNPDARWLSPKICSWLVARAGCWFAPCWRNPESARCQSKPTSSVLSVRMSSLSAMGWMSRIPTASCRSSDAL